MLLDFKESIGGIGDISLISLCVDDTEVSISFPGWKISLMELHQADSTIIVEMRLRNDHNYSR